MLLQTLLVSLALATACRALNIEDNRPGAIPLLFDEVSTLPGGWSQVPERDFDSVLNEVNLHVKQLQAADSSPGSPQHRAIKIKRAITSVVAGSIQKVVFTVGQLNNAPPTDRINPKGQYGECFFEIFFPLGDEPSHLDAHRCVKITKQEAYE